MLCAYSAKRRPAPRQRPGGREEAGRAPGPRRPRSQGQLHSSLQTVTSSPAHPSPTPLPPPHNCLLHLSEGAAKTRRRPAPLGTSLGSWLWVNLPDCWGEAVVPCSSFSRPPTAWETTLLVVNGPPKPSPRCCNNPQRSPPISIVPLVSRVLSSSQFIRPLARKLLGLYSARHSSSSAN